MSFDAIETHQNDRSAPNLVGTIAAASIEEYRRDKAVRFVTDCMRISGRVGPSLQDTISQAVDRVLASLPPPTSPRIVAAAIRAKDGVIWRLSPAGPHADIVAALNAQLDVPVKDGEEGFLTSHGQFVGREEAFRIAFRARQQMKPPADGVQTLLLEDIVW